MNKKTALLIAAVALTGCATKRYGRLEPLSPAEKAVYTCREIAIEQSKVDTFEDGIKQGSRFNGASALGALGDFGIGNANEKNAAERSASTRRADLRQLSIEKGCDRDIAAPNAPSAKASQPQL